MDFYHHFPSFSMVIWSFGWKKRLLQRYTPAMVVLDQGAIAGCLEQDRRAQRH